MPNILLNSSKSVKKFRISRCCSRYRYTDYFFIFENGLTGIESIELTDCKITPFQPNFKFGIQMYGNFFEGGKLIG